MNLNKAYETLGLQSSATEEEVSNAFRSLAAKNHPDRFKDNKEAAEAKFKEINEAYQTIKNPEQFRDSGQQAQPGANFWEHVGIPFQDIFGGFAQQKRQKPQAQGKIKLTFNESVLGCKKTIPITRHDKCTTCDGHAGKFSTEACKACNGQGVKRMQRGNMNFQTPCNECQGKGKNFDDCTDCKGVGSISNTINLDVDLPGGFSESAQVRLGGAGNFERATSRGELRSDAIISVEVETDPDMKIVEDNVVSNISVSLLEALKGSSKKVRTVKGELTLKVRPKTKNKDQLRVGGYGVNNQGAHIFNVTVEYPEDVQEIINILEK